MLAFAHIPTSATAGEGFNNDEVNGRSFEPATAVAAIGQKSAELKRLRLPRDRVRLVEVIPAAFIRLHHPANRGAPNGLHY
jgi:hypothetical protein